MGDISQQFAVFGPSVRTTLGLMGMLVILPWVDIAYRRAI
jgi:hypothetical protein